jgi:hypothetical protein
VAERDRLQAQVAELSTRLAAPRRKKLPRERPSITYDFTACGLHGYLHVGFYPDSGKIGELFVKAGPHVEEAIKNFLPKALDLAWTMIKFFLFTLPKKLIAALPGIIEGLGKLVLGAMELLQKVVMGVLGGIEKWLVKKFPESADTIRKVFSVIRMVVGSFFKFAYNTVKGTFAAIKFAIEVVTTTIRVMGKVAGAVFTVMATVAKAFWSVRCLAWPPWTSCRMP